MFLLLRVRNALPRARRFIIVLTLPLMLVIGCTGDDDENGETPTSVPATLVPSTPGAGERPSPTAGGLTPAATSADAETVVPATLSAANGQTITDGLCVATIPDGWVDDGTGRGTTPSGAPYVLFGGRLRSDADWKAAVDLVKKQAEGRDGANVDEGDDFVRVDLPDDGGFEYRGRFADRYCDFSVSRPSQPIPPEERAFWDAIIASLAVAE